MRRFVVPAGTLARGVLELSGDVASHVRDVLRLSVGERVQLSDGAGQAAIGELVSCSRRAVSVQILELSVLPPPVGMALTLIPCIAKGEKIDAVVRQSVELGVRELRPVIAERSVGEKRGRVDRWRAIAEDAIRIADRAHRPLIADVVSLEEVLRRPRAEAAYVFALGGALSFKEALDALRGVPATMELLIGPEGGLSEAELEGAEAAGFTRVHLGPHTLRAETAGPAIAAIALFWAGVV